MTNPDTWDRYVSYGGNFGTPTVIIDGTQKIIGGGPLYLGRNRFNVYDHFIRRESGKTPPATIEGNALLSEGKITVEIGITPAKKNHQNPLPVRLHIALVEKSIGYAGGNGISTHAYVVRKIIDGIKGVSMKLSGNGEKITRSIELAQVERELRGYLDTVSRHPSWRPSFVNFPGWKIRPDTINPANIAVVAWIQDPESQEILQAFFCDVEPFRRDASTK
jgi:hypothetical protein